MKRMKTIFSARIVLPVMMVMMVATSCKKDTAPGAPGASGNDINVATSATLGRYLTNKNGLTLYMFANDADGASTCTGDCEKIWPAFGVDLTTAKLDTALKAS